MKAFSGEQLWSTLCTSWTVVFMVFVVANFFLFNRYEPFILPLSAVYAGVLTLYAGTKEFDRWYDIHDSRHPGELFIIAWTVLIFVLAIVALFFGGRGYVLDSEVVADYIMVLSVFAITQKSKQLHRRRRRG
ncbi:MAG: hypothetical protein ABSE18_00175 [Minisyncoccia bacterium]|jgi:hypothetical protein